jgi:hypoxanthine-DNA glycosylase
VNPRLRSFPPICREDATRLILGSMPGAASLQAGEYYAHPRNAFWSIAAMHFGAPGAAGYAERVLALQSAGIAVWDVLQACRRSGSLDSDIEPASMVANDLRKLLGQCPGIRAIYFNGGTARQLHDRLVLATLTPDQQRIPRFTLPSTSPANARLTLREKSQAWRVIND